MTEKPRDNMRAATPRHGQDDGKRRLTLWLVVGGIMALVLAVWIIFLPYQIGREQLRGALSSDRWQAGAPETSGTTIFNAQMRAIQTRLEEQSANISANGNNAPAAAPPAANAAPVINDEALKQGLEEKLQAAKTVKK